jgi:uncharacterized protein YjbI with pentapeptide repeats
MFTISPCAAGCGRPAITGSNICFIHQANPEQETRRISELIITMDIVKDLNASGMRFENIDFSRRRFYGCNFREASFSKCVLSETVMRLSLFEFATFYQCEFSKTDLQFLSFAGARIRNCSFEGSELAHVNFVGAAVSDTVFNNSDLYNSRFINADLEASGFVNCNLKRTYFISARQQAISFKASNTAEAVFELEE